MAWKSRVSWRLEATQTKKVTMQNAPQGAPIDPSALDGRELCIGVVQARFNSPITDALAKACLAELAALGVAGDDITHLSVPGALEVPIALQSLAMSGEFDALIALGCIIRGETYHFELVANESGRGVTQVSLEHTVPVANAILTVETEAQAWARAEEKGRDAARVAVEMGNLINGLAP
jgi:6,7-dimethyl-8-ribityllumazine synthase